MPRMKIKELVAAAHAAAGKLPPAPTCKPHSPGAAGLYGEGNHGKANESESLE